MVNINDKIDCCGCEACIQVCPQNCITSYEDNEGFIYPIVNHDYCINCNLCEKVCPIINKEFPKHPIHVFAAKNSDDYVRAISSSGGVFLSLAKYIINVNGIVFGAAFDNEWNVMHKHCETLQDIIELKGSKYVQSKIGLSYKDVKNFLLEGKDVLFTGTPCQIAGLKKFLMKDYEKLVTVEILCHGVPSPKVWRRYLSRIKTEYGNLPISSINFRNKKNGWSKYNFTIEFDGKKKYDKIFHDDLYFKGFLKNLYLRPTCYSCKFKNGRSGSDITIADYWSINEVLPKFNDDKGVSLILVNSNKGLNLVNKIDLLKEETDYDCCKWGNGGFYESLKVPNSRNSFFDKIDSHHDIFKLISESIKENIYVKFFRKTRNTVKRIIKFMFI